ncbi:ATP-binding protein [Nocardioides houyundeii]|uniref:HD domain-containing protein n=1 Tax=Nocardioides houyundeii TaxID=2045452 RepID=UPI000DF153A8|nr:ATP-binding protein [Nocardioides houyundeii]
MTFGYEETRLWTESLADRDQDPYAKQRVKLSAAYHNFRERAALVAAEIPQELREFTVHDVTHLDALWELADQVAGDQITLTPTEAFVLGGAFLIHDLGMGLAAWPGGLEELKSEPTWRDTLASCIRRSAGDDLSLSQLDNPPAEALRMAVEITLRERHAFRAAELALTSWESRGSGNSYRLIEETDLRERYGELIGEIAASHWWDISRVAERFSAREPIGAPVDCPNDWTVDELKLACLMRVADAAHLDERRAPAFLRAIRDPSPYSDLHWAFQGYLQRPRRSEDQLVFTSARAFRVADAQAWWVCYESLQMVDRELRGVDSLLLDRARPRFAAKGVRGIEGPDRLAEYVKTSDWSPVDARPRIDNVSSLVRQLGGESLYGDEPRVALREMIQNARDATMALEELIDGPTRSIRVELTQNDQNEWVLTVSDFGIGMSGRVMSHTLLDFGQSYWGSDLVRQETPGLLASRFAPVGRFGIGFFSVFMLGDRVTVVSRRYDDAAAGTKVLEFSHGVASRPILRPATRGEVRDIPGTSVSVVLRKDPSAQGGLLATKWDGEMTLASACALMAPAIDCNLDAKFLDEPVERAVTAGDWLTLPGVDLLRRISSDRSYARTFPVAGASIEHVAERLEVVMSGGLPVARVALSPSPPALQDGDQVIRSSLGVVIGGFRAGDDIGGLTGIVVANPTKADRAGYALPLDRQAWAAWASSQASQWSECVNSAILDGGYTEWDMLPNLVMRLGGDPGSMYIARTQEGLMTLEAFLQWASSRSHVKLLRGFQLDVKVDENGREEVWHRESHRRITLLDSIVAFNETGSYGSWDRLDGRPDNAFYADHLESGLRSARGFYYLYQNQAPGVLLRALATAWSQPIETILDNLEIEVARESVIGHDPDGIECQSDSVSWSSQR